MTVDYRGIVKISSAIALLQPENLFLSSAGRLDFRAWTWLGLSRREPETTFLGHNKQLIYFLLNLLDFFRKGIII